MFALSLNGARVRSGPQNSSFSLMVLAKLLMSLSRARGLGGGGVGIKLRPLFNTDSSCLALSAPNGGPKSEKTAVSQVNAQLWAPNLPHTSRVHLALAFCA